MPTGMRLTGSELSEAPHLPWLAYLRQWGVTVKQTYVDKQQSSSRFFENESRPRFTVSESGFASL